MSRQRVPIQMFYQNCLGDKRGKNDSTVRRSEQRAGPIIHSTVTLTTLTCGQLWSLQKPVVFILCLVTALWFICLSQRPDQVQMKYQNIKDWSRRRRPRQGSCSCLEAAQRGSIRALSPTSSQKRSAKSMDQLGGGVTSDYNVLPDLRVMHTHTGKKRGVLGDAIAITCKTLNHFHIYCTSNQEKKIEVSKWKRIKREEGKLVLWSAISCSNFYWPLKHVWPAPSQQAVKWSWPCSECYEPLGPLLHAAPSPPRLSPNWRQMIFHPTDMGAIN